MTIKYIHREGNFLPTSPEKLDIRDNLEVGVYNVKLCPKTGFSLDKVEDFKLPSKLYGQTTKQCERILSTFEKTGGKQLGVFLEGRKGSGKTLLAKVIAVRSGFPCIVVNTGYNGEEFLNFLKSITQPCVVIFDEFEKLYPSEVHQNKLLTFFDGTLSSSKIVVVTVNNKKKVGPYFINRPGRFRYTLSFSGLEVSFINEYMDEHLKDNSYRESILETSLLCTEFNFDILQTIVEECNLYGGDYKSLISMLNVEERDFRVETWTISFRFNDKLYRYRYSSDIVDFLKSRMEFSDWVDPVNSTDDEEGVYFRIMLSDIEEATNHSLKGSLQVGDDSEKCEFTAKKKIRDRFSQIPKFMLG